MSITDKFIVIGLVGAVGSGRKTVANILSSIDPGFCKCSFADFIWAEAINAFGVSSDLFTNSNLESRKDPALAIVRCGDVEFIERMTALSYNLIEFRTPAEILHLWGTEYRRNQDPEYWAEQLSAFIHEKIKSGIRRFVVPDLQFIDDIELIIKMRGEVWLIRREDQSSSVDEWDSVEYAGGFVDRIIRNDRDEFSLTAQVIGIYSEIADEEAF